MKALWISILACLALVACKDEASPSAQPQSSHQRTDAGDASALYKKTWLSVGDEAAPEVWLAAKAEQNDHPRQETVAHFRDLLHNLDTKFHDGPRMIANRSVQLETMLAEQKIDQPFMQLLEGFGKLSEGEIKHGVYGELCAQYFTLRKSGRDHEQAMAALVGIWSSHH